MNRQETIEVMKRLKTLFPKHYMGKDKAFHENMIREWEQFFKTATYEEVTYGIDQYEQGNHKLHPKPKDIFIYSWEMKKLERLIEMVSRNKPA